MAVLGITRNPETGSLEIPTEVAATAYGLAAGIGGGLAQLIYSNRLTEVSGSKLNLWWVAIPAGISMLTGVVSAFIGPLS